MPFPDIQVTPVHGRRDRGDFIGFPWRVYRGDPHWVAPLRKDMSEMLDVRRHPFYEHGEVEYFLARRRVAGPDGAAGEVVGRIAAIINRAHNEFHREKTGFFGFFEVLGGPDRVSIERASIVTTMLVEAAADWLRARGMIIMRGPASFSSNEEYGLLVDGFDSRPMILMPYNPPYYGEALQVAGFHKAKDLVAYTMDASRIPERVLRIADLVNRRARVRVRPLDKKNFTSDVNRIRTLYNAAWEANWGFVPMTDREIDHMAASLKSAVDPQLVLFAEHGSETIGFALALPDLNQALQKANGRLLPFGLIRILLEARKIKLARVLTLGVVPQYRGMGADVALYAALYRNAVARGYRGGEFSWVLEDNHMMRSALEELGAHVYKTYRIYERSLLT